jgi:hypothetical protein
MANIQHVPIVKATLRKKEPAWQTFGTDDQNLLWDYKQLIDGLGLDDPTEATARLEQAILRRRESRARGVNPAKSYKTDKEVVDAVLSGEIDMRRFDTYIAKIPTAKELLVLRRRERKLLASVATSAFRMGCRSIREHGDGFQVNGEPAWLRDLKPIAEAAVANKDQQKWHDVHALGKFLRGHEIAALSMGACGVGARPSDLPLTYYQFRDVEAVHRWRLQFATKSFAMATIPAGKDTFIYTNIRIGPQPTVKDIDLSWGPSLWSAEEALANAAAVVARQEREIAEATPAEPERVRHGRAVSA